MSGLLPLSLKVVGTGISRLTMEALLVWRWAAGGRQKTRAVGRLEDLVFCFFGRSRVFGWEFAFDGVESWWVTYCR